MMVSHVLHFIQRRMLWLLVGTYVLGASLPRLGLALGHARLGTVSLPFASPYVLTVPACMLGFLLLVAGLGTRFDQLRTLERSWRLLALGLLLKVAYPVLFVLALAWPLSFWPDAEEAQSILVGLAILAAMPIAGASTAWSQNSGGALPVSIALVLLSMVLSPLLTPLALHAVGAVTVGDYSEDLHELAAAGVGPFVLVTVLVPALLGLGIRAAVGARRCDAALPVLKAINLVVLLLLNYANASNALPQAARYPDWDLIAILVALTLAMCAGAFSLAFLLARTLVLKRPERASLVFGVGMSNNGAGLVLASAAMADHVLILLPIIVYNLAQQLIAALVDRRLAAERAEGPR